MEDIKDLFKDLRYAVYGLKPETDILRYYNELANISSWKNFDTKNIEMKKKNVPIKKKDRDKAKEEEEQQEISSQLKDKNKIFRWIIYAFDNTSFLIRKYENVETRRKFAAIYAGLDEKDAQVKQMISLKIPIITKLVVDYLKHLKNYDYQMLIQSECLFWEVYEISLMPIDVNDDERRQKTLLLKKDSQANCAYYKQEIEKYKTVFFRDNKDLAENYEKIKSNYEKTIAEDIAEMAEIYRN